MLYAHRTARAQVPTNQRLPIEPRSPRGHYPSGRDGIGGTGDGENSAADRSGEGITSRAHNGRQMGSEEQELQR